MSTANPFLQETDGILVPTAQGWEELARVTTDPRGRTYAFTSAMPAVTGGAVMAKLSRTHNSARLVYLNEFANNPMNLNDFIRRVLVDYGDDSVAQLVFLQLVCEGVSNLLTKRLEWGRLAGYLEPSTRYIFFDQKDKDDNYLYHKPHLPPSVLGEYCRILDEIFATYSKIVRSLTAHLRKKHPEPKKKEERTAWLNSTRATACDAARPTLPVATLSTVAIVASAQAIENMIINLLSEDLIEAQERGEEILREVRKIAAPFFERTDRPDRGGATTAYKAQTRQHLRDLAGKYLSCPTSCLKSGSEVTLVDYHPRDELELVANMLFEQGYGLSLEEIYKQTLPHKRRVEIFHAYMGQRLNRRHKPGRALEVAHFEWELLIDYGIMRDLQRHRLVDDPAWQLLSPYLGYDIPDLIYEIGLEADFRQCFDESSELYELMIKEGLRLEAQYATLLGHKMRYHLITNLRELFHLVELRTSPQGHPGYRRICNLMHQKVAEVYPLSAAAMIFVNQGESEELYRMAAEVYKQFKLERMEES